MILLCCFWTGCSFLLAAEEVRPAGDNGTDGESLESDCDVDVMGSGGDDDDMEEEEPDQAWNAAGLAPGVTQILVDGPRKPVGECTS